MDKSEMVEVRVSDGIAILNYDNSYVRKMAEQTQACVLYVGLEEGAEVRGSAIGGDPLRGRCFTLGYHGEEVRVQLHLPGEHGVTIALAAAAAGCAAVMALNDICM